MLRTLANFVLKPFLQTKINFGFSTPLNLAGPLVSRVCGFHITGAQFELDKGEKELIRMHRTGPIYKVRPKRSVLDGRPQMRGVVIRTLIKKPRKPNSANRKCVLLRLSNGKEAVAYVPGVGHNLQEHNVVLVEASRLQDVSGVKMKVIRGKYDCAHVIKNSK